MDLIEALAIQLGGTMTMRDSDGARTVITFPQRLKG
jgi:two-component sensor histidine kinase